MSQPTPSAAAPDPEMLLGWLQRLRETIVRKVDGLDDDQARRTHPPSGITLIALVKHLTDAERTWFVGRLSGTRPTGRWSAERSWHVEPGETLASVVAGYQAQWAESDRIVRTWSPVDGRKDPGDDSGDRLSSVLAHMIQETARHAGHADLIRESIDGETGT